MRSFICKPSALCLMSSENPHNKLMFIRPINLQSISMALVSPTDPLFQVIIRLSGLRFFPLLRLHSWWKTKQTRSHETPVRSRLGAGPAFGWAAFQPSYSAPSRPPLDAAGSAVRGSKPHLIPEDCDQCFRPLFIKHTHTLVRACILTHQQGVFHVGRWEWGAVL